MLRLIQLYLPVLFPSWRFFKEIEPSARVEFRVNDGPWRAATPRPSHVGGFALVLRLVWNPYWNETLYLVSCAERLVIEPTPHSVDELFQRIARRKDVRGKLVFRLVFCTREGDRSQRTVDYISPSREFGA